MHLWAIAFAVLLSVSAHALEPWQTVVPVERFQQICERVSKRVEIFDAIWHKYPRARFYGGTARDFAWFVRGKLAPCRNELCVSQVEQELLARIIDTKEFVVGESDIDVVDEESHIAVDFDRQHFTRIETIRPDWLRVGSAEYQQEEEQGGIAVEKILLGADGFQLHPVPAYRGGLEEIWRGHPTMHFDARVSQTRMFRDGGNHPLLLVLRYLRQVGVAYYQLHGKGLVDRHSIERILDGPSVSEVENILRDLRRNPQSLDRFLAHPKFRERLNRMLRRIFRSYTNPNAAKWLFEHFEIDGLFELYEGKGIDPYHTVLYSRHWDQQLVAAGRAQHPTMAARLMTVEQWAAKNELAFDNFQGQRTLPLFHGTRSLSSYRSIVLHGILPSSGGSAGEGPYAVDMRSRPFAYQWSSGHVLPDNVRVPLVAKLHLRPGAIVLDISDASISGVAVSNLAAAIGADVVRYSYGTTHAYVVYNGEAILGAEGDSLKVMPLPEARAFFQAHADDTERLRQQLALDPWLARRLAYLLPELSTEELFERFGEFMGDPMEVAMDLIRRMLESPDKYPPIMRSKLLERFLWRPLRSNTIPKQSALTPYYQFIELLNAGEPLMGTSVFRSMAAANVLRASPADRDFAAMIGLAIEHWSFEPGWIVRYAEKLLLDPDAYRAEVSALTQSTSPVLAIAFQGLAERVAERSKLPNPPFVPVTLTVADWVLPIWTLDKNNALKPAMAYIGRHLDESPHWGATLQDALEQLAAKPDAHDERAHFHWDVSAGFSYPYGRHWSVSEWKLFAHVGSYLKTCLEVWRRAKNPEEHPNLPVPQPPELLERFFQRMNDRAGEFQWPEEKAAMRRLVHAWLPADRHSACAGALLDASPLLAGPEPL